ncbi:MAG: OmpA family protein [Verrucomicrobiales bacterium]
MNRTTALIFFGIIILGAVISLVSLKSCRKSDEPIVGSPSETVKLVGDLKPAPSDAPVVNPIVTAPQTVPAPTAPETKEKPAAAPAGLFESPAAAMKALAEKVVAKDYPGFVALVGSDGMTAPVSERVKALVEGAEKSLASGKPFTEISKSAEGMRWSLNFVPVSGEAKDVEQVYADMIQSGENRVDISGISFPLDLTLNRGGGASATPGSTPEGSAVPAPASDALTVAHAFSKAVIQRDFNAARELSDQATVSDERVAALMIAVEEGGFVLKEDRPLVVTLSREDVTWVLARVQSESMSSEFALELGQIDRSWKVNGLTFSKVLSVLSERGGAGNAAYSPIVEDPAGGDSLVIYFEFDEAGLTERAQRQLQIVAEILAQGKERVIRINGHADAVGSEDYNVGLSDKRAESIRQTLISMGVSPEQVITEAFGAAKPRSPNFLPDGSDNPGGRSRNRRAEVLLDF